MCIIFLAEKDFHIGYTCVSLLMTPRETFSPPCSAIRELNCPDG